MQNVLFSQYRFVKATSCEVKQRKCICDVKCICTSLLLIHFICIYRICTWMLEVWPSPTSSGWRTLITSVMEDWPSNMKETQTITSLVSLSKIHNSDNVTAMLLPCVFMKDCYKRSWNGLLSSGKQYTVLLFIMLMRQASIICCCIYVHFVYFVLRRKDSEISAPLCVFWHAYTQTQIHKQLLYPAFHLDSLE